MFHTYLKWMCILLVCVMIYVCQLGCFVNYSVQFFIFTDILSACSISYWECHVKMSHYDCGFPISPFSSVQFCFKYFEAILLGVNRYEIVMSSWRIHLFKIIKYFFLFLVIFCLKVFLSDTDIDASVFFWLAFAQYTF